MPKWDGSRPYLRLINVIACRSGVKGFLVRGVRIRAPIWPQTPALVRSRHLIKAIAASDVTGQDVSGVFSIPCPPDTGLRVVGRVESKSGPK